jgi:hypothetical protein
MIHVFTKRWTRVGTAPMGERGVYVFRKRYAAGLVLNYRAGWIGAHWGQHNKRLCINLLPFVTLWITMPGGA